MEAQVSARFPPQTSQELVINVYQYLKYKTQEVEDVLVRQRCQALAVM